MCLPAYQMWLRDVCAYARSPQLKESKSFNELGDVNVFIQRRYATVANLILTFYTAMCSWRTKWHYIWFVSQLGLQLWALRVVGHHVRQLWLVVTFWIPRLFTHLLRVRALGVGLWLWHTAFSSIQPTTWGLLLHILVISKPINTTYKGRNMFLTTYGKLLDLEALCLITDKYLDKIDTVTFCRDSEGFKGQPPWQTQTPT